MAKQRWFLAGLFLTTLATLTLETLDTRLLSVMTWYHLSFFAVSVAMLGMAAGAVHVYLGGERFQGEAATRALPRLAEGFAFSVPVSHLLNLSIPIVTEVSPNGMLSLIVSTMVMAAPFYLSGLVVSVALTRVAGSIGLVYAVDLLGAALGSLVILALLTLGNVTSAVLAAGAIAAAGAACFRVHARQPGMLRPAFFGLLLVAAAMTNSATGQRLRVLFPKGNIQPTNAVLLEYWSLHGQVTATRPVTGTPPYWSPGELAPYHGVQLISMSVDGGAGTVMTGWDGRVESLGWTEYDLTALAYHIRKGGDAAVIGVGGGRDLLAALWGRHRTVTGIEINSAFIRMLEGKLRTFSGIVDQPGVRLVHDEARSYLTRITDRYDVLQMSLIDTWAATGAGAFTLSENGLYTVEGWDVFLRRLKPGGVFSVSRWYAPTAVSETSRLVALATAALIRSGVEKPADQLVLYARGAVATLLVSNRPFSPADLSTLRDVGKRLGFVPLVTPGQPAAMDLLSKIVACRTLAEIDATVRPERYDYTPPSDERPYFFNVIKPTQLIGLDQATSNQTGVVYGNLLATLTLLGLLVTVTVLVLGLVFGPLIRSGLPRMTRSAFLLAVLYFGLIGAGFMMIQIGLMQRFSVYLGYPTYSVAVVLFSMILATGIGSFLSDRLAVESSRRAVIAIPTVVAALLVVLMLVLQPIVTRTIGLGLVGRCLITVAVVLPVSLPLGMLFPMGMRLVRRLSEDATPWMWGVNGAVGVLASVLAVAVSMWSGIHTNLALALAAYGLLVIPALALWKYGAASSAR